MNTYISLTTVPKRLKNWESFSLNLKSLINQKTNIDYKIILSIPTTHILSGEENKINEELIEMQKNNSKLIINKINKDYGPITKIIGALPFVSNPEDVIIVCDDDQFYHEEMLEYHLKMRRKYNQKTAICFRGDSPVCKNYVDEDRKNYNLGSFHTYFPVKEDCLLVVPGHWHSVSYSRNFFGEDFLDKDFLELSDNDDFLVGYYFKKKRIPIICALWDKETDFTPVNSGWRPSSHFPIECQLSYELSGFNDYRILSNNHTGRTKNELFNYIHDNSVVYQEFI